jgi:hypothetical protein
MNTLKIQNLGQIKQADIRLGDLNVFVGPQATGKSVFLQLFKLLVDAGPVIAEFRRYNIDWSGRIEHFLDLYFGEGMASIFKPGKTVIERDGEPVDLAKITVGKKAKDERVFLIPAQRVMALREGLTRPFTDYRSGDPFAVREFSERLHHLVQSEFSKGTELFPVSNRLKKVFRDKISQSIFGEFGLRTDPRQFEKRLVLNAGGESASLPYLVWSAGQREFVPLLLGFYWLMPPAKVARRGKLEWVIIEELEMGLHPEAITTTLLLVLELIERGYKVCLSTHAPHVLDLVWALRTLREEGGGPRDFLKLFKLPSSAATQKLAAAALKASTTVHYFSRDGQVQDISDLDPDADSPAEADWGGLSEFSSNVHAIIADVVNRSTGEAKA